MSEKPLPSIFGDDSSGTTVELICRSSISEWRCKKFTYHISLRRRWNTTEYAAYHVSCRAYPLVISARVHAFARGFARSLTAAAKESPFPFAFFTTSSYYVLVLRLLLLFPTVLPVLTISLPRTRRKQCTFFSFSSVLATRIRRSRSDSLVAANCLRDTIARSSSYLNIRHECTHCTMRITTITRHDRHTTTTEDVGKTERGRTTVTTLRHHSFSLLLVSSRSLPPLSFSLSLRLSYISLSPSPYGRLLSHLLLMSVSLSIPVPPSLGVASLPPRVNL